MPPELVTGIFTSAGAVIGVLSASLTAQLAGRAQRRQGREARRERVADARRQVYAALLAAAVIYMNACRVLNVAMSRGCGPEELAELERRYEAAWSEVIQSTAAVEVSGPAPVGERALTLRRTMGAYSVAIEDRIDRYRDAAESPGSLRDLEPRYAVYRDERARLITLMHEALDV